MMHGNKLDKQQVLMAGLAVVGIIFAVQLFRIQVLDDEYKISAENNALRYMTVYPSRGLILDRNGLILAGSKVAYDIMATPADVSQFDTAAFCSIFHADTAWLKSKFRDFAKRRRSIGYQSVALLKQVPAEQYNVFSELSYKFPGFTAIPRSIRDYPFDACGNLLGYVSEVDAAYIKRNPDYKAGDMAGKTGIELVCEDELRGEKGNAIFLRDVHNRILSRFMDGEYDKNAIPGNDVVTTIDAGLQQYIESLMKNKVGSVVAIEPATGEILALVSSPGISTDKLAEINKHYEEIASDPLNPMFNRAIMSSYPPGSVFKILNGLVALDDGLISTSTKYPCHEGYAVGNFKLKCHEHKENIDFTESIMMSCNAYYCYVFRDILDNPEYSSVGEAMNHWNAVVRSFGFGSPTGCELPSEQGGTVPDAGTYDRVHGPGRWKSLSAVSLSIGQGELGVTPLQLANYASILANRGYWHVPHLLKCHDGGEEKYEERHYTLVDTVLFESVIKGMYQAVNRSREDGATAWMARAEGLEICGKTGTAQNPHGEDNAVFIGFAPKENPRIAIAVYLENTGFGGTWAAPLGSLAIEKYLTGGVSRPLVEKFVKDRDVAGERREMLCKGNNSGQAAKGGAR